MNEAPMRRRRRRMRVLSALILTSVTATTCTVAMVESPAASADSTVIAQQVAVPSYIHPNASPADWLRLSTSTPGSVGIAVANVINGPDYTTQSDWQSVIHATHANGVQVLGYVDTGYLGSTGQSTRLGSSAEIDWISQIERDVDTWYSLYGADLSGIFFDQGQNVCGTAKSPNEWADTYRSVGDYVKRAHPSAITVLNPGTVVPQCYENSADVLVTFEDSYASYTGDPSSPSSYTPLAWDPVDPKKIWHMIYGASTIDQMSAVVSLSKARGAGYVYVTDDVLPNPYDRLPAADYWNAEEVKATTLPPLAPPPPSPPSSLDSINYSGTTIDIGWDASTRAGARVVAYDIFRDGVRVAAVPATSTTYRAVGLEPTTTYLFTVQARDALGRSSAPSNSLIEHTDETYGYPPTIPRKVEASATGYTSTVLSWQRSKERGKIAIAAYIVLQNGRPILRLPGSAESVTIGKLAPGSKYAFTVAAVDETGGQSGVSSAAEVSTPALPGGATIGTYNTTVTPDALSFSAEYLVPFAFRRVFIASGDPSRPCWSTGSEPQMCADFVIENSRLLRYVGAGTDWDWTVVQDVVPTVSGATFTWSIPPAAIGSPTAPIAVVFNANGYAPNSYCGLGFACTVTGPPLPYE